jgi:hypothetical protein
VSLDSFPTGDSSPHSTHSGNGFDLMHGVKSSYYNSEIRLERTNPQRFALETYQNVEDYG